jgi:hypothetical protein
MGFFTGCSSLKELNAANGTFSADIIVDWITIWQNITVLDVSDCEFNDKGMLKIVERILKFQALVYSLQISCKQRSQSNCSKLIKTSSQENLSPEKN